MCLGSHWLSLLCGCGWGPFGKRDICNNRSPVLFPPAVRGRCLFLLCLAKGSETTSDDTFVCVVWFDLENETVRRWHEHTGRRRVCNTLNFRVGGGAFEWRRGGLCCDYGGTFEWIRGGLCCDFGYKHWTELLGEGNVVLFLFSLLVCFIFLQMTTRWLTCKSSATPLRCLCSCLVYAPLSCLCSCLVYTPFELSVFLFSLRTLEMSVFLFRLRRHTKSPFSVSAHFDVTSHEASGRAQGLESVYQKYVKSLACKTLIFPESRPFTIFWNRSFFVWPKVTNVILSVFFTTV